MIKSIHLVLLLLLIPLVVVNTNNVTATAGNSPSSAIPLAFNTITTGTIDSSGYAWYNITLNPGKYSFNLTYPTSQSPSFYVLYPNGNQDYAPPNYGTNFEVQLISINSAGTYSIEVSGSSSGTFSICVANPQKGQTLGTAIALPQNKILTGQPFYNSYYNFTLIQTGYYKVNLTTDSSSFYSFILKDNTGKTLNTQQTHIYPENLIVNLTIGNYFIQVSFSSGLTPFYISLVPYTPHQGELLKTAYQITQFNTTISGTIPYNYYFNFSVTNPGYYNIILNELSSSSSNYFTVQVYDQKGNFLGSPINAVYPYNIALDLTQGSYYLEMFATSLNISLKLKFSLQIQYPYTVGPGQDLQHAIFLHPNTPIQGNPPNILFYNFTISTTNYYGFNYTTSSNDLYLAEIFNYQSQVVSSAEYLGPGNSRIIQYLQPGNYYLRLLYYSGSSPFTVAYGSYTPQPGDILQTAIPLSMYTIFNGSAAYTEWFNFTITTSGQYQITLNGASGINFYFEVFDYSGTQLTSPSTIGIYPESSTLNLLTGNYSIGVFTNGNSGKFSLFFTPYPNPRAPTNPTTTPTSSSSTPSKTVTTTPFSPIFVILGTFVTLSIIGFLRKRK